MLYLSLIVRINTHGNCFELFCWSLLHFYSKSLVSNFHFLDSNLSNKPTCLCFDSILSEHSYFQNLTEEYLIAWKFLFRCFSYSNSCRKAVQLAVAWGRRSLSSLCLILNWWFHRLINGIFVTDFVLFNRRIAEKIRWKLYSC